MISGQAWRRLELLMALNWVDTGSAFVFLEIEAHVGVDEVVDVAGEGE